MGMFKKAAVSVFVFLATIILLWAALYLTSLIPNESIRENMTGSSLYYKEKKAYTFDESGKLNRIEDCYADAVLLNVLWNIKSEDAFVSSLDTKYYDGEEYGESLGLYLTIGGTAPNTDYSRYWHGSVVFIRPLLLVTDVVGIRNLGLLTAIVLLAAISLFLIRKRQYFLAAALPASYACVHFWRMQLSMEYQSTILISLCICLLYLLFEKRGNAQLICLASVSGVMTAFFDFLTTETLTITIPLLAVLIVREQEKRNPSFIKNIRFVISCGFSWGLSYGMTFLTKWILVSWVTGENRMTQAISSAELRFGGDLTVYSMPFWKQVPSAVAANLTTLFGGTKRVEMSLVCLGTAGVLLLGSAVFYLLRAEQKRRDIAAVLLLIALIPYVRYMVLSNHSYLHEFFTYRAQAAAVLALAGALWFNIDLSPIIVKQGKGKRNGRH